MPAKGHGEFCCPSSRTSVLQGEVAHNRGRPCLLSRPPRPVPRVFVRISVIPESLVGRNRCKTSIVRLTTNPRMTAFMIPGTLGKEVQCNGDLIRTDLWALIFRPALVMSKDLPSWKRTVEDCEAQQPARPATFAPQSECTCKSMLRDSESWPLLNQSAI